MHSTVGGYRGGRQWWKVLSLLLAALLLAPLYAQSSTQASTGSATVSPPALPAIPVAGAGTPKRGPAPPELPAAKEASREERRFNPYVS